jgi:hypothetical protein
MLELPKGSRHELPSENIYIVLHGEVIVSSSNSKEVGKNKFRQRASIASLNTTNPYKSLILADDSMRRGGPVDGNGEKVGKKFGKELHFADFQSRQAMVEVESGLLSIGDGSITSSMKRIQKTAKFIGKVGANSFVSAKIGSARPGTVDQGEKIGNGTPKGSIDDPSGSCNGDDSPKGRDSRTKQGANFVRFDSFCNAEADASILEYYIDENCNNQSRRR